MPGIVGLITKLPRSQAEPQLLKMLASLQHESFYTSGTLVDEQLGVYLGWVVRRNSFADGMPLASEKGDVLLVFSGKTSRPLAPHAACKKKGIAFSPTAHPTWFTSMKMIPPSWLT